jgi:hypothetical protein
LAVQEKTSERLDSGMEQKAHVGNTVAADPADFLIRKSILKLEPDDFPLIWREVVQ